MSSNKLLKYKWKLRLLVINTSDYKNKEYYRSDLLLQKINYHRKLIGLDILDFGCGSGFTLSRISSLFLSSINT